MLEDYLKIIAAVVNFFADALTIFTATLVVWAFFKKGPVLSAAIKLLINYSYQTTLHELRDKLERLNEYNASNEDDRQKIINILHELQGQIAGNIRVKKSMPQDALDSLEKLMNPKSLTEPRKRSLVSQIREVLKNLNVESFEGLDGVGE